MEMIWIGIGVAALILELLTPSALVSIWFAVGALAAWICTLLGLNEIVQVLVCLIVSVVFIIVVRPFAVKYLRGNIVATNADRLIGDYGIVTKEIGEDSWGEVRIQGTLWSAVSLEHTVIPVGTKVLIAAIEGAKLIVRELNK